MLQQVLDQLKIKAKVVNTESNGTITRYDLKISPGEKVGKIERATKEIALGIRAYSEPIVKVITEQGIVSLELLTKPQSSVSFYDLKSPLLDSKLDLPVILGRTHDGHDLIADLSKMPHLLIAGATGSGKSVMLHSIISSLVVNQKDVKLALIDPKSVELTYYEDISTLMYPIITDPGVALQVLCDLVDEMNDRFDKMAKLGVNNIVDFNAKSTKPFSYVVLVIDEFSDLMYQVKKDFQKYLCMLAQKCRAAGLHLILATQRPSTDVVTGLIKANFPARISCRTTSLMDSRVVLDSAGAEKLLGKGDALIKSSTYDMIRFKGAFISPDEVSEICGQYKRSKFNRFINYVRNM